MKFNKNNIENANLKLLILFIVISLFVFHLNTVFAQTPTVQDCAGAIPICQNTYHETNSYSGMGNYPNEIDSITSCTFESNCVWYTFTAQTSGNFSFILTPNNTSGNGDDYDWSVYNLTNATCSDIYNDPSLEISCNSWGDALGFNGATGASTASGGIGNHNGPGTMNGPPFNADIPVTAGNIYVMMVSNWSGSPYGYTIDFSSSTAQIYDNVPPKIHSILSNIACGATSITFDFSENILCNTIAPCDLSLTGPGGPYTITSVTGTNCASGGTEEKTFTITFNPAIKYSGLYYLNLNSSTCNSVTDLCGNAAPSGSLSFSINLFNSTITTTPASCSASNGSATVSVTSGTGNYTYQWNTNPPQTSATATNLTTGTYIVTISNGNCTGYDTANVSMVITLSASITNITNETCGMSNGSATVTVNNGSQPFSYNWNTNPPQTTATATNLSAGNYSVTISDANGCTLTLSVPIIVGNAPSAIINATNAHCDQSDGSASAIATGGSGNYSYLWSTGATTSSIQNLSPGVYSLTVSDGYCDSTATTTIANQPGPKAEFSYSPDPISINNPSVTFTSGTQGAVYWEWNFGDGSGLFYGNPETHKYDSIGSYPVTLVVSDSYGCNDTITDTVIVHDIFTIFIPSCFTPNGNGVNDVFQPIGISWETGTYEMVIFNRWGNIVYQTTDPSKPWNGGVNNNTDRSKFVPDVYVYRIKVKGIGYDVKTFIGTVTLLK